MVVSSVVHHLVFDHLAQRMTRQKPAASLVASLVLDVRPTIGKEKRPTWVPLAVIGLVHVVATLIHC